MLTWTKSRKGTNIYLVNFQIQYNFSSLFLPVSPFFPFSALKIFLNIDSGYCRHLITPILVKLWAIQKWMKVQRKFKFYSTSILIVYDCRVLKQFLEQKKLFPQENPTGTLGNGNNLAEKVSGSGKESPEVIAASSCNQQPIHIYRQIQKSHSLSNDYNKVRRESTSTHVNSSH